MSARPDTQPVEFYDENGARWERRTVKRHCNGCDESIGDATDAEIEAGFAGRDLPDVRHECPTCTPAPVPHFHWGRSFGSTELEDACPCPKAPCGLVDTHTVDQDCEQHGWRFAKTSRQGHRAEQCTAAEEVSRCPRRGTTAAAVPPPTRATTRAAPPAPPPRPLDRRPP